MEHCIGPKRSKPIRVERRASAPTGGGCHPSCPSQRSENTRHLEHRCPMGRVPLRETRWHQPAPLCGRARASRSRTLRTRIGIEFELLANRLLAKGSCGYLRPRRSLEHPGPTAAGHRNNSMRRSQRCVGNGEKQCRLSLEIPASRVAR